MGSGKSTAAFQYIKDHPEFHYVYCTPLLSEINRIQRECPDAHMIDPKKIGGKKINGFNRLLEQGKNVAVSHATFALSDEITMKHIRENNYILFMDEVLDVLLDYNDIATKKIRSGDPKLMLNNGLISVDRFGKVKWIGKDSEDSSFNDVKKLADRGSLFYLNETLLVWKFPPEVFDAFDKTYIMTFLFAGSYLKPYFQYHSIPYELATLEDGVIVPYHPPSEEKMKQIRELITIDFSPKRNNYNGNALSRTFYLNASKTEKEKMKSNIYNYTRNVAKATSRDVMWTAFEDVRAENNKIVRIRSALKGPGYVTRKITSEEERKVLDDQFLTDEEKEKKLANMKSCYVANNARASNDYRDRRVLVYALNLYCNGYIKNFFSNKNEAEGRNIHVDEDAFSLSCMLQWIWRSQIRDGKPIKIYIPSTRMRNLLVKWLNGFAECEEAA